MILHLHSEIHLDDNIKNLEEVIDRLQEDYNNKVKEISPETIICNYGELDSRTDEEIIEDKKYLS